MLEPLPPEVAAIRGRLWQLRLQHRERVMGVRGALRRRDHATAARLLVAAAQIRAGYAREKPRLVRALTT